MFCYNLDCVTDTIYIFIFAVQAKVHQCAVTRGLKSLYLERKVSTALDFTLYCPGTPQWAGNDLNCGYGRRDASVPIRSLHSLQGLLCGHIVCIKETVV